MMGSQTVRLWLAQSTVIFFLVCGIFLLVVGMSLIVNSAGALRLFGSLNRWVSMRRATKALEIPRDTRPAVQKYRYVLAAVFVAGGVFAIIGLVTQFNTAAVITLLHLDYFHPTYAAWLADGARWILIVGNLAAIVAGILLAFFPDTLRAIEARGGDWYSERKMARGADTVHVTSLDTWVAAYPRPAGVIITVFALGLIGAFGLLLPGLW